MASESYQWSETFQFRLLAFLLREPEKMYEIVEPQFFSSPVLVEISRILKEAYSAHGNQTQISKSTLVELVRATMGEADSWPLYKKTIKKLYKTHLTDKPILYKQAFEFARESKYRETLISAEKDITNRNYARVHARIDDLRTFGKDPDTGLTYWVGLDRHGIKTRWTEDRFNIIRTGLKDLDRSMGGGLAGGELGIILAGGKVGKTTTLANFARSAMFQGKIVAIASGELSARKYRRRIDAMISGVVSEKLQRKRKKVLKKLLYMQRVMKGNCHIKQFPTGKASTVDIENWLTNLEESEISVDLLIVDYLALFRPAFKSPEHRLSIGQTGLELRGIAVERNIPVWTASQGNRAALSKRILGPQDFAEDISQFWTLDFMLALCQDKREEKDHHARVLLAAARDFAAGAEIKCRIERDSYRLFQEDYDDERSSSSSDSKSKSDGVSAESSSEEDPMKKPETSNDK